MKNLSTITLAGAAVLVLTLTACGSDDSSHSAGHGSMMSSAASPATAAGRQGDIRFAQQMIPHHRQAVQMADMALNRQGVSADVTRLAAAIKKAQDPEINTMTGWLKSWGATVPTGGDHSGHDMSSMSGMSGTGDMTGMMSQQEMDMLGKATGPAFDRMWLTMMVKHHQGAVTMSSDVKKTTDNPEVSSLADSIIKAQNAEIRTMQDLLKTPAD